MELLNNKTIIVTGGAGLLGKEFIRKICNNGGIGIAADINEELGQKALKELDLPNSDFFKLDICSKKSITDLIKYVSDKYGKIDGLVNNAYPRNKNYGRKFEEVEYKDFCENVNLHLGGYFLTSQQFAVFFKNQGYGNIINISSVYGVIPPRFEIYDDTEMTMPVEYAAIKSGVVHLTKYIAKYYKNCKVRCNALSLGGIKDNQPEIFLKKYRDFTLSKGMLDKQDVSGTLIFLLSDMSKHINGQNIIIDDGFTL